MSSLAPGALIDDGAVEQLRAGFRGELVRPGDRDYDLHRKAIDKVVMENKETIVESSKIPSSSGDEAGTLKGLVSSTNMSVVKFKKYSSKVYAKGKKIVFHTAVTAHNGSNANLPVGSHVSPSQSKVVVAT